MSFSNSNLVIVESPHTANALNRLFGARLFAMPTYGPICSLASSNLGTVSIDPETLQGRYELTDDAQRHIDGRRAVARIREYLTTHPDTTVYLAMQNNQAGEFHAARVAEFLQLQAPRRLRFNALTHTSMAQAMQAAGGLNLHAVAAYEAGQCIDHIADTVIKSSLKGVNATSTASFDRTGLAIDALVVERERLIGMRTRAARPHFSVHLDMGDWSALWQPSSNGATEKGPRHNSQFDQAATLGMCFDATTAHQIAQQRALLVQHIDVLDEIEPPPSALDMHALITAAEQVMGWPAGKTLQIAQQLYEGTGQGGHITLPRTFVTSVAKDMATDIHRWLGGLRLPVPESATCWPHQNAWFLEGAQAICPTQWESEDAGETEDQKSLYALIRERTLYSQLSPARYSVHKAVLTDASGMHTFKAISRVLADPGWLGTTAVNSLAIQGRATDVPAGGLPQLQQGNIVNVRGAEVRKEAMGIPSRYTPTTLLNRLQVMGLAMGLDWSEFARLLRGRWSHIRFRDDGSVEPTEIGQRVYDTLYPRFGFAHLEYATELAQALDKVACGDLDGKGLVRTVWDRLAADATQCTTSGK